MSKHIPPFGKLITSRFRHRPDIRFYKLTAHHERYSLLTSALRLLKDLLLP
jgi:hypothetical protein